MATLIRVKKNGSYTGKRLWAATGNSWEEFNGKVDEMMTNICQRMEKGVNELKKTPPKVSRMK